MFPAALKGRDRLVWAALAAAGLQGRAVPILKVRWDAACLLPCSAAPTRCRAWLLSAP